jgi:hypothetical protein
MKCSLKLLPGRAIYSASGKPPGRPLGRDGKVRIKGLCLLFELPMAELPVDVVLACWTRNGQEGVAEWVAQVGSLGASL